MSVVIRTLHPSPAHSESADQATVSWAWLKGYFDSILAGQSAEEASQAYVEGWPGLRLCAPHINTAVEDLQQATRDARRRLLALVNMNDFPPDTLTELHNIAALLGDAP